MAEAKTYDNYPLWIVFLSDLVSILIYGLGAFIIAGLGYAWLVLYLFYVLWTEVNVLKRSCQGCYYHGKICAFGKGKICSLVFNKVDPQKFAQKKVTWLKILPDFMVLIFPLVAGIILLVRDFNWLIIILLIILIVISLAGDALIGGALACKYCRQREIGCPAERLFRKKNKDY